MGPRLCNAKITTTTTTKQKSMGDILIKKTVFFPSNFSTFWEMFKTSMLLNNKQSTHETYKH